MKDEILLNMTAAANFMKRMSVNVMDIALLIEKI